MQFVSQETHIETANVVPLQNICKPTNIPNPLDQEQLSLIQEEFIKQNADRQIQFKKALEKGPIEASKAEDLGEHHVFTHLIQPQLNAVCQGDSALCWVYAPLSLLSINFIRDHHLSPDFQFSAAFLTFYDKLERANLFLHRMVELKESPLTSEEMKRLLKEPIEEGGEPCGFANIVNKYGLAPIDAMPHSHAMTTTKYLNRALYTHLRLCAKDLRERNGDIQEMIAGVYKILAVILGVPPAEFDWTSRDAHNGQTSKKLTPLQFAQDYVKYNSNDYIELGNNPLEEYGTLFEADRYRNTVEGSTHRYVNVKMDDILASLELSLEKDYPLLIASDVRLGKHDIDGVFDAGYAHNKPLYGEDRTLTREDALKYGLTECYHMMVITGYTPKKRYQLLNTWSLEFGKQGYYAMSVDYARLHLCRIIIRTEFVTEEIKEIWKTAKPRQLGFNDLIL